MEHLHVVSNRIGIITGSSGKLPKPQTLNPKRSRTPSFNQYHFAGKPQGLRKAPALQTCLSQTYWGWRKYCTTFYTLPVTPITYSFMGYTFYLGVVTIKLQVNGVVGILQQFQQNFQDSKWCRFPPSAVGPRSGSFFFGIWVSCFNKCKKKLPFRGEQRL